jgi:type IV pilus assembly protein PilV
MSIININTKMIVLTKTPRQHKISGFTLIEVLIAMLILSVGLLGLAGFQASSARNNTSAYNRSQATQLAYDLADRIRANAAD